jgi:hypothetical protein
LGGGKKSFVVFSAIGDFSVDKRGMNYCRIFAGKADFFLLTYCGFAKKPETLCL